MIDLKPCPFCGGEVTIAVTGHKNETCYFITRGNSKTKKNCKCRVFMDSDIYRKDEGVSKEKIRNDLVDAWNRRADHD